MAKKKLNDVLFYLGFGVAISTLILNIVEIRYFMKQKENSINGIRNNFKKI